MIFVLCTVPWRCALKILETECHPISSSAVVCVEHRSSCSKSKHQKISWFIFICGRLAIVALHERWQWCANDMKIEPGNIRKSNPEAYHHGPEILKEACTFQPLLKVIADRICPHHFFSDVLYSWLNSLCLASLPAPALCCVFLGLMNLVYSVRSLSSFLAQKNWCVILSFKLSVCLGKLCFPFLWQFSSSFNSLLRPLAEAICRQFKVYSQYCESRL